MGGFGSVQGWSKKAVVEGCYSIDTARMKRWKLLIPGTNRSGSFEWRRGDEEKPSSSVSYRISVGQTTGTLRLLYAMKSANADLDYPIQLVTTGCHLGGVRWWFLCPLVKNGAGVWSAGAEAVFARQILWMPPLPRPDLHELPGE